MIVKKDPLASNQSPSKDHLKRFSKCKIKKTCFLANIVIIPSNQPLLWLLMAVKLEAESGNIHKKGGYPQKGDIHKKGDVLQGESHLSTNYVIVFRFV